MSERNRYGYAALGFTLGVGLALLFLVWSFPGFRKPTYQQDGYQHARNSETGKDNPVIRPSIWERYTSPTDTYAQWIMAILSFVATGVSIWAVWLVRDTLVESRRAGDAAWSAVEETRRIGEAQVRAYIAFSYIDLIVQENGQIMFRPMVQSNYFIDINAIDLQDAVDAYEEGRHFFVLGKVLYTDIFFTGSEMREETFCYTVEFEKDPRNIRNFTVQDDLNSFIKCLTFGHFEFYEVENRDGENQNQQ